MRRFSAAPPLLAAAAIALAVTGWRAGAATRPAADDEPAGPTKLAVVWTSGDPEVAHRMTLMYAHAAQRNGWFDETRLIVWGPSARLLAADKDLQQKIAAMRDDDVIVEACVACADSYGVADRLRELGLEVKLMGEPLTELLRDDDWRVATF